MGSLIETIQKKGRFVIPSMPYKDELPISSSFSQSSKAELIGIRKRISVNNILQPTCLANSTASSSAWAFRNSRSMSSSLGGPLRRWWERSWGWLLSKKPTFAKDIEMNEEEVAILGCNSKGTLGHVFYKIKRSLLVRTTTLPITHHNNNNNNII